MDATAAGRFSRAAPEAGLRRAPGPCQLFRGQRVFLFLLGLVFPLDAAAGRRVPLRGGELEIHFGVDRNEGLDEAFTVSRLSDDDRPMIVLKRTGDDLRCGSGRTIDEDDERHIARQNRITGRVELLAIGGIPSLRVGDELSLFEELLVKQRISQLNNSFKSIRAGHIHMRDHPNEGGGYPTGRRLIARL